MAKETLKIYELQPYLPFGLQAEMINYKIDYTGEKYDLIRGLYLLSDDNWHCETLSGSRPSINDIKPILRPLTELAIDTYIDGKTFTPLVELLKNKYHLYYSEHKDSRYNDITLDCTGRYAKAFFQNQANYEFSIDTTYILNEDYKTIIRLIKWKFDVFGLIKKGLAKNILELERGISITTQK